MPKKSTGGLILVVILAIIGFAWYGWQAKQAKATVYDQDTQLEAAALPAGNIVLKDSASLTINGNLTINDQISCQNGPLSLIVNGDLTVNGELRCERSADLDDGDLGNGLLLVVTGNLTFNDSAVVATNGHVQITDDASKLARSQEDLDKLYDAVGQDTGEGFRIGPFIEIPLAPGQTSLLEPTVKVSQPLSQKNDQLLPTLINVAQAQEPAVDDNGNPVPNTVKIGGTWVVGNPGQQPPPVIQVPTPPKKIKKIILDFDFGGADMQIQNLTLYGPDGQNGSDDTGSCNVQGGNGSDAYRMNVSATNITINNFTLYLGYGGNGGFAETSENCEDGRAKGGNGGQPANLKMVASQGINIIGTFTINPGQGGLGGQAIAHGKKGQDGCAGEKGGDATANGGNGGDNKKGLKVVGNVQGVANVTLNPIVAGAAGEADAFGGQGGNGTGPGCRGGDGGKATATGGKGGDATSRSVASHGGNGGDVQATAGAAGNGGQGSKTEPGGDGGTGGDATATPGKGGTGLTTTGQDGAVLDETGGNGGNGGDGCNEGKGGKGGKGNPPGTDGKDGKNLCEVEVKQDEDISTGGNINVNTNINTNSNTNNNTDSGTTGAGTIEVNPPTIQKQHIIGETNCPTPLGNVTVNGPAGGSWFISGLPSWLQMPQEGSFGAAVPLAFNCQITDFTTHQEQAQVQVQGTAANGTPLTKAFFSVTVSVEKR